MDKISVEQAKTLDGLFRERVERSPDAPAYISYSTKTESWHDITWQQAAEQVSRWQAALANENLRAGDRVALNLRNCKEWVFFDQAAMSLGLVVVPLYPDDRPDNVAYILQDAGVKLLLLQNGLQWKRLQPALDNQHEITRTLILSADDTDKVNDATIVKDWLPDHAEALPVTPHDPHQLASIIYTSGTTGRPKGVMLSHHNMLFVSAGSLSHCQLQTGDLLLSFLPLSHTLERTAGYYLAIMAGCSVAYSRGITQLAEDIITLSPSILFGVPRIYERVHQRLTQQLSCKPFFIRWLFMLNVWLGWQHFQYRQNRCRWQPGFLLLPTLNKLFAVKLQQAMGGKMRIAISGGAPLPVSTAKLFISLGVQILQGYGLTETSPVISVNEPNNNFPESVGRPIPGVEVKIGNNNELLSKSPGNMLGYWNNHKETARMIDAEGWLHTGDQARISQSGHIYITGRIKDILVLSNGEKLPPTDIEAAILSDDLYDQAVVLGEGKAYLTAILVLNQALWFTLAKQLKLNAMTPESLHAKALHQYIIKNLRSILHDFPAYAKIRRVTLTLDPWTIESGILTPTMKIKRAEIKKVYKQEIEAMYQ